MTEQLELDISPNKPAFNAAQAGLLLAHLGSATEPMSAGALAVKLGYQDNESGKRRVRRLAEDLPQVVSINAGYLHIRNATNAHYSEYDGRFASQIRKMEARRARSRVEWNKYHRENNTNQ